MEAVKAKTKSGKEVFRPKMDDCEYVQLSDDYTGFCISCGETQEGCEPDARGYECESCGQHKVYGLEELMMMGYIILV